jgi:uncharacterized membrane protein YdbT with pleckstrin-like domain
MQLLAGENPVRTARQHWSVLVPGVVGSLLALLVGAVLMSLLPTSILHFDGTRVKQVVIALLAVGALGVISLRWLQWHYQTYTLTDRRIVVHRGVIARVTESITLDRVQDTVVRQGLWARLIGCGNLEVESAGRDGVEVLHRIPNPQGFCNELMAALEAHRTGRPYTGSAPAEPSAPV